MLTLDHLQVISEAQKRCNSVSGGTEIPALLSLADAALSQFVTSLQARTLSICHPLHYCSLTVIPVQQLATNLMGVNAVSLQLCFYMYKQSYMRKPNDLCCLEVLKLMSMAFSHTGSVRLHILCFKEVESKNRSSDFQHIILTASAFVES